MKNQPEATVRIAVLVLPALTFAVLVQRSARSQAPNPPRGAAQAAPGAAPPLADGEQVPLTISGGHATDRRDGGRPVVLIAAALGVPAEAFRAAFRGVTPARGAEPEPAQVQRNKQALMQALGPYGITNERLDTVSNFYRYNGSRGEMWRNTPATAYATIRNGVVTGITITNPGAGYSSPPLVTLAGGAGPQMHGTVAYGTDFNKNGSLSAIATGAPEGAPGDNNRGGGQGGPDGQGGPPRRGQGGPRRNGPPPPPPPPVR